jgi:RNA polymerase sigma factor (sigma-70 family)
MNKPLTEEQRHQVEDLLPYLNRIAGVRASSSQERDDFRAAAYFAACIAVRSWKPDGGESLKTWVGRYVRSHIHRERRFHAVPVDGRTTEPRRADESPCGPGPREGKHRRFIDRLTAQPSRTENLLSLPGLFADVAPDDVDILKKYLLVGLTLDEIGAIYGLTRERIRQRIDAALSCAARRGGETEDTDEEKRYSFDKGDRRCRS